MAVGNGAPQAAESEPAVLDALERLWTDVLAEGHPELAPAAAHAMQHLATRPPSNRAVDLAFTPAGSAAEAAALVAVVAHDHSLCDNALDCY